MLEKCEPLGRDSVGDVPCTVWSVEIQGNRAKLWQDSLGIMRRLQMDAPLSTGVVITIDPVDNEAVWTPPGDAPLRRYEQLADEYLSKAVPADKPIMRITALGREFTVLSVNWVREDLLLMCTSTQLLADGRAHRDEANGKWAATQLHPNAPEGMTWVPRLIARLHMPYREISWWAVAKGTECSEADVAQLIAQIGRPDNGGDCEMEKWLETRWRSPRLKPISINVRNAGRVDLERYLRDVYAIIDGYRNTVGEAGKADFMTPSADWKQFKDAAGKAREWRGMSTR